MGIKHKKITCFLGIVLALLLAVGNVPLAAFAEEGVPSAEITSANPLGEDVIVDDEPAPATLPGEEDTPSDETAQTNPPAEEGTQGEGITPTDQFGENPIDNTPPHWKILE